MPLGVAKKKALWVILMQAEVGEPLTSYHLRPLLDSPFQDYDSSGVFHAICI